MVARAPSILDNASAPVLAPKHQTPNTKPQTPNPKPQTLTTRLSVFLPARMQVRT